METRLKILLPTDYSELAMDAERYAIRFAKNTNFTLVFLHVYQIPYSSPSHPLEFVKSAEELHLSERKRLEQHCEELFTSLGIGAGELFYECVVREGSNVGKQIIGEAEESNADFIIVGTHAVNGFRKLFFGSHAWDVIKKSNIPVFAIPKDALFNGIKNIVFGTEYREGEIPGLNFLVRFAMLFDAEVTVLHITNYVLTKKFETEMFEKFRTEIMEKLSYPKLKIHLMVNENISEGVDKFCVENKADLLVMSPEKTFLFGKIFMTNLSMTRRTIFHTHIPLMAIPDFYNPEHSEFWGLLDSAEFVNKGR